MIIIGVLLYKRSDYTRRCFEAIAKLRGIENCRLICNIDPYYEDVVKHAYNWTKTPIDILVNSKRLGCNKNMFSLCERCFAADDGDGVTVIEDDIEISSDWLEFCTNPIFRRINVDAVSAYQKHDSKPNIDLQGYSRSNRWGTWGWYSWKEKYYKWRHVFEENGDNGLSWDTALCRNYFFKQNQETIINPVLSRSFNYGKDEGTYCSSHELYYRDNFTRYYWNGEQLIENIT